MKIREACKKLTTAAKRSANCQIPSPWGRFHFPEYLYLSFERCYERFMELHVEVDETGASCNTNLRACSVLSPSHVHRGMSRSGAAQGALSMGAEPWEPSCAAWTCRGRDGAGTRRGRRLRHALTALWGHPGTEHLVLSKGSPRSPSSCRSERCTLQHRCGMGLPARKHRNREPRAGSGSWATPALPSQTAAPSSGRLVGTKRLSSPFYGFGFSPSVQVRMFQSFVKCLF